MRKLFYNKLFFLMCFSQITSDLCLWINYVGISIWILKKFNSPSLVALFISFRMLVGFLASLIIGHLIDRYSKRMLMIFSNITRGLLILSYIFIQDIKLVFLAGLTIAIFEKVFDLSYNSYFPIIIEKNTLMKANSVKKMASSLSAIIGPVVGGGLFAICQGSNFFIINSIFSIISAVLIIFLHAKETHIDSPVKSFNFLKDTLTVLKFITFNINFRFFLIIRMIDALGSGVYNAALPLLGKRYSQDGEFLGTLLMAWGIGSFVGSLITARFKKQTSEYKNTYIIATITMAFFMGLTFFLFQKHLGLLTIFLGGVGDGVCEVLYYSFLMQNTPKDIIGKVYSITNCIILALVFLGTFCISYLLSYDTVSIISLETSLFIILGCLIIFCLKVKKVIF